MLENLKSAIDSLDSKLILKMDYTKELEMLDNIESDISVCRYLNMDTIKINDMLRKIEHIRAWIKEEMKVNIEKYATDWNVDFGDILLTAMGYNANCILFCKCKNGGYNLAWITENGDEFIKTFYIEDFIF